MPPKKIKKIKINNNQNLMFSLEHHTPDEVTTPERTTSFMVAMGRVSTPERGRKVI